MGKLCRFGIDFKLPSLTGKNHTQEEEIKQSAAKVSKIT
jgi:hypothetical protein